MYKIHKIDVKDLTTDEIKNLYSTHKNILCIIQ